MRCTQRIEGRVAPGAEKHAGTALSWGWEFFRGGGAPLDSDSVFFVFRFFV